MRQLFPRDSPAGGWWEDPIIGRCQHDGVILPAVRDPRLVTVRRGGSLSDADHVLLALWAAACARRVLPLFESAVPGDERPRQALSAVAAWACGDLRMMDARAAGGHAMGAARPLAGAPRFAAYAAGRAACVPHVPEHDLGAAAYAIKAVMADRPDDAGARTTERDWQLSQIPENLLQLVLQDQARRNDICWGVFAG